MAEGTWRQLRERASWSSGEEAACGSDVDIAYIKIPKSAVTSELKEKGLQVWQSEWDTSSKGELTKTFFLL